MLNLRSRLKVFRQRGQSWATKSRHGQSQLKLESLEARRLLAVVGRHLFYNNSAFDGNDVTANAQDDGAIAPDKLPLFPGQFGSFNNYSSYSRGINGVMVDLADTGNVEGVGLDDFEFRSGRSGEPETWDPAPQPVELTVRPGEGVGGSDRVTLIWADQAIENAWLQVTVLANDDTGLVTADKFSFGNQVGESGDRRFSSIVDGQDEIGPQLNPHAFFNLAEIDDAYDYNRDRYVNATDQIIARNASTDGEFGGGNPAGDGRLDFFNDDLFANSVTLVYDPITGEFSLISNGPAITTLEILSASGLFSGETGAWASGLFDVQSQEKLFKLDPAGFTQIDFGTVLPPGLSLDFLLADLLINGSVAGGAGLFDVEILLLPSLQGTYVLYDAMDGDFVFSSDLPVSNLEIVSAFGVFTGEPAQGLDGPNDEQTTNRIFKADQTGGGFNSVEFGATALDGLTEEFLVSDLTITGAYVDGSEIGDILIAAVNDTRSVAVDYDSETGAISVSGPRLESVEIVSQQGIFTGVDSDELLGPDDVDSDEQIRKQATDSQGFVGVSLENVGQVGWPASFLLDDLSVGGTLLGGSPLEGGRLSVTPSSNNAMVTYNVETGEVVLDSGWPLSEFEISSSAGLFTNEPALNLGGPNDVDTDSRILKQDEAGFNNIEFGSIGQLGPSDDLLFEDLTFRGTLTSGAGLGPVDIVTLPHYTRIVYLAETGELSLETNEVLTTLEIVSASSSFIDLVDCGVGLFDVCTNSKFFKVDPSGFGSRELGLMAPGLLEDFLREDLSFIGSIIDGGMPSFELVVIPEMDPTYVTYDASTGNVAFETPHELASFEIISAAGFLNSEPAQNLGGDNDVDSDNQILKQDSAGFGSLNLGSVIETGLTESFLDADVSFGGQLVSGEELRNVQLIIIPQVNDISVTYDAATGNVSLFTNARLENLSIESFTAVGIFSPFNELAMGLDGPNDSATDTTLFKQADNGFRNVDFGPIAKTGYLLTDTDLRITANLIGGDPVAGIDFELIPEPPLSTFTYDANTGAFSIDTTLTLTTLEIVSARGIFTGEQAIGFDGQFDRDEDNKLFKLEPTGFGSLEIGSVAEPGLPFVLLEQDLSIAGSRIAGGPIGQFEFNYIPAADAAALVYRADTGQVWIESNSPLATVEINSNLGILTAEPANELGGPNDVDTDRQIVKQDATGFSTLDLGSISMTGLTNTFIQSDVSVSGTTVDGTSIDTFDRYVIAQEVVAEAIFDASTGEVSVTSNSPFETFEIVSTSGIFTGNAAQALGGVSDVDSDTRIFKLDENGFRDIALGDVGDIGLDAELLTGDLSVSATLLGGDPVDDLELTIIPDIGETTISYSGLDGSITVLTNLELATLDITSLRGIFTGAPAAFGGPNDIDTDTRLFKSNPAGFSELVLPNVAATGLTTSFVTDDVTITGTRVGGGGLGQVRFDVLELTSEVFVAYDPETGGISAASNAPLESITIRSSSGVLTGTDAVDLTGPNDIDSDNLIFKMDVDGFTEVDFGAVALTQLLPTDILDDLTLEATLLGGQTVSNILLSVPGIFIVYDSEDGSLELNTNQSLATIQIDSGAGIFTGEPAQNLGGLFDLSTEERIFKLDPSGFSSIDFGLVAEPNLEAEFVRGDLTVDGAFVGGGALDGANVEIVVINESPVLLTYEASTGLLSLESEELISSIEIVSAAGIFSAEPAMNLGGAQDVDTDTRLVKQSNSGFDRVVFGDVAGTGYILPFLKDDLSFSLTFLDGRESDILKFRAISQVNDVDVIYDTATGTVSVESNAPLEAIDMRALLTLWVLNTATADNLDGPNDLLSGAELHKEDPNGLRAISFGPVAQSGRSAQYVETNLELSATLLGGELVDDNEIELVILPEPQRSTLRYDATTGNISLDTELELTTLEIVSQSGIFTGDVAANLGGQFDIDNDQKIFKLQTESFGSLDFGNVAKTGIPRTLLEQDLSIAGSRKTGGPIGNIGIEVVPLLDSATLLYDARNGELSIEANPSLVSLEITSSRGIFNGEPAAGILDGPSDLFSPTKITKIDSNGFGHIDLGGVLSSGLTESFISGDLSVSAFTSDGPIGNLELVVFPHEPAIGFVYDGATGEIRLTTNSPLESVEIVSATGVLVGDPAQGLDGPNDVDTDTRLFKTDPQGFNDVSFGFVAALGVDGIISDDLTFSVTLLGGEAFEQEADLEIIPDVGETMILYDHANGTIIVESNLVLESIEFTSSRGIFTGEPTGLADIDTDTVISVVDANGFESFVFESVALPGLTEAFVAQDLSVNGKRIGGGGLGHISLDVTNVLNPPVVVSFDGRTGMISVNSTLTLESVDIVSAAGIFTATDAEGLGGPQDVDSDIRLFKQDLSGFNVVEFGSVALAGWSRDFITQDLTITPILFGGEEAGDLQVTINEDVRAIQVWYDLETGELSVETDIELQSITIASATGIFTGDAASGLGGPQDVDTDFEITKTDSNGFSLIDFGVVGQIDLSPDTILADLTISAVRQNGVPVTNIELLTLPNTSSIHYDATTGSLTFEGLRATTTLEIKSAGSSFIRSQCRPSGVFSGLFDVCSESKLFKLDPAGFGHPEMAFGAILPPSLTREFLVSDLSIDGSFIGGGNIRPVRIVVVDSPAAVPFDLDSDFAGIRIGQVGLEHNLVKTSRQVLAHDPIADFKIQIDDIGMGLIPFEHSLKKTSRPSHDRPKASRAFLPGMIGTRSLDVLAEALPGRVIRDLAWGEQERGERPSNDVDLRRRGRIVERSLVDPIIDETIGSEDWVPHDDAIELLALEQVERGRTVVDSPW